MAPQLNLHNRPASVRVLGVACTTRGGPLEGQQQRQKRTPRLARKWIEALRKTEPTGRFETGAAG